MTSCPHGFRIVGGTWEARRVVDAAAALAGYAACDDRAEVHREAYLSAFQFGEDFRRLLLQTGSTAGYSGPCWSPWLWWDIDAEDLEQAQADAGAIVEVVAGRYAMAPDALMIFFSGSKGFHLGLPTALWSPAPSLDFHRMARRFAEHVAELAAVTIDTGVYDRVRVFRAPNSRHPKTGLHKRRLTFDELLGPLDAVLALAKTPAPFSLPTCEARNDQAAADWQAAADQVKRETEAKAARHAAGNGSPTLNHATLDRATPESTQAGPVDSEVENPPERNAGDSTGLEGQSCQQVTGATDSTPVPDLQAALARLWGATPAPNQRQAAPQSPTLGTDSGRAMLPPDPPPLPPLPPGAVGSGKLDKPCRCKSTDYVDVAISEGRTRRDCRKCGRFIGWGKWYDRGGPTPRPSQCFRRPPTFSTAGAMTC